MGSGDGRQPHESRNHPGLPARRRIHLRRSVRTLEGASAAARVRTRSLEAWQPQPGSYSATAYTFIPEYLPIAERDATMLVVDLRTSNRRGLIREFDKVDNDDETPTWEDLATLLDELIDALTHRTTFLGWQPATQDGRLIWSLAR